MATLFRACCNSYLSKHIALFFIYEPFHGKSELNLQTKIVFEMLLWRQFIFLVLLFIIAKK